MDYCLEYKLLNDESHVYKSITIDELLDLLNGFDSGLVFLGGPWCKNCQAIIDIVNTECKKAGLEVVYNYDPRFTNIFGETESLFACKSLETKLKYYTIVERVGFKSQELVTDTLIPAMHVPFFIALRFGKAVGYYSAEYIMDDYLHEDGKSEDMTEVFRGNIVELINKVNIKL